VKTVVEVAGLLFNAFVIIICFSYNVFLLLIHPFKKNKTLFLLLLMEVRKGFY